MSDLGVKDPVLLNSGSVYEKAPFNSVPRLKLGQWRVRFGISLQIPKSHILQLIAESKTMFSGFRFPCTIFSGLHECKNKRALETSAMILARIFHVKEQELLLLERRSWRFPLGKYSYIRDQSSGHTPIKVTRWGCCSLPRTWTCTSKKKKILSSAQLCTHKKAKEFKYVRHQI